MMVVSVFYNVVVVFVARDDGVNAGNSICHIDDNGGNGICYSGGSGGRG